MVSEHKIKEKGSSWDHKQSSVNWFHSQKGHFTWDSGFSCATVDEIVFIDPVVEKKTKDRQETAQRDELSIQKSKPHKLKDFRVLFTHIIRVIFHHLVGFFLPHDFSINFITFPAFVNVVRVDPKDKWYQKCHHKEHETLFFNKAQMMCVKVLVPDSLYD